MELRGRGDAPARAGPGLQEDPAGPLRSPKPAGSPELWPHCVFLSSGRLCLHWLGPAQAGVGGQVLLPAPWGFWLEYWGPGRSGGQGNGRVSPHPQKQPPHDLWAQLVWPPRTEPGVAGEVSPKAQEGCRHPPGAPAPPPTLAAASCSFSMDAKVP